jgi:hypothetical protein
MTARFSGGLALQATDRATGLEEAKAATRNLAKFDEDALPTY